LLAHAIPHARDGTRVRMRVETSSSAIYVLIVLNHPRGRP
jgi:hypothetical protein